MRIYTGSKIDSLNLSTRTFHCLKRAGINSVAQLINDFESKLLDNIPGVGISTMEEIEKVLENIQLVSSPTRIKSNKKTSSELIHDNKFNDDLLYVDNSSITNLDLTINDFCFLDNRSIRTIGQLYRAINFSHEKELHFPNQIKSKAREYYINNSKSKRNEDSNIGINRLNSEYSNLPLSCLKLSIRPYNALRRYGIDTIGDLYSLVVQFKVDDVRYIGEKANKEIKSQLEDFLNNPNRFFEPKNKDLLPNRNQNTLLIDIDSLKRLTNIPLDEISIDRLVLPSLVQRKLKKLNINSIGDFPIHSAHYKYSDNVLFRVEHYLDWISKQTQKTWENEVNNKGISPLHYSMTINTKLDDILNRWFFVLNQDETYSYQSLL